MSLKKGVESARCVWVTMDAGRCILAEVSG